jgi:hypothetical protein
MFSCEFEVITSINMQHNFVWRDAVLSGINLSIIRKNMLLPSSRWTMEVAGFSGNLEIPSILYGGIMYIETEFI